MRQKRPLAYFLLLALFAIPLSAEHYYSFGKRIELSPIQKSFRGATKGYMTRDGKELYLSRDELLVKPKNSTIEQLSKRYSLSILKGYLDSIYLVTTKDGPIEIGNQMYEAGDVEFATPNFEVPREKRGLDPLYPQQWYLKPDFLFFSTLQLNSDADIKIEDAWRVTRGAGVKVAVIDDGFDVNHPEISSAIIHTYSADNQNSNVAHRFSSGYHGTACAGLVGARENSIGIKGVAPESSLILIQLTSEHISDTIDALNAANSAGADVISNSWGTYHVSDAVAAAIDEISKNGRNGKGTLIVFASGNHNKDMTGDESALPSVIGVGSTNAQNVRSWFSNYGEALDIVAPGGGTSLNIATIDNLGDKGTIKSSSGHGDYIYYNNSFQGTSASAPIVAGVAALLLAANPSLTRDELYNILTQSADKIGTTPYLNGKNIYYGYGKLNAKRAMERLTSSFTRSLNLAQGWNLISLPRGDAVAPSYFGDFERIWSYSNGIWYTYPNDGVHQEISYLVKNKGFWIKSQVARSINFSGQEHEFEMQPSGEWQLLGTQKELNYLNNSHNATVWKYQNGEWQLNPATINPGEGFWIKK